jgi:hypothetical protein
MSLKDDLTTATANRPKSGPKCITCSWFNDLTAEDQEAFNDYIGDRNHNRALLFRVISEKWGFPGCDSSLKYHLQNHHEPC